jgi:hypothetical protein
MAKGDDSMNLPTVNQSKAKLVQQRIAESNYASEFYREIVEMIHTFEIELDSEHEIGVRLVSFGQAVQFHVDHLGYYNPSLIKFKGTLDNGSRVELIQHVNQISFLLMALPKQVKSEPAKRIGFKLLEEKIEKESYVEGSQETETV